MPSNAEADHRTLIESIEDLVWSVDLDYRLMIFNSAVRSYFETSDGVQPVAGMLPKDLFPPERAGWMTQLYERALTSGSFRTDFFLVDGRPLELSFNPIRVDGKAAGVCVYGKDTTAQKRVEQELRESRDSLQEAQAIGGMGSYVLNFATGLWTSSPVMDEIFGIDEGYLRDVQGWGALVHPDDRAMMLAYFAEEVAGKKKPFDKEYRILRPSDRGVLWVHGRGKLEFDDQGRLATMRGVIRDITLRKLADLQLIESEERFRATFEQAPIGILHVGLEAIILRCNKRIAEFLGYTPEELVGMSAQQVSAPEDLEGRLETLKTVASGAVASGSHERRYRRKDGSLVWANSTVSMQRDADGCPLHFIILVEDIDARKRAETSLQETTERLTLATRAGGVGIWDWDIENDVLVWDEQMYRLYGVTPARFSGAFEAWQKGLHPDDRQHADEEILTVLRGGKEYDSEFRVVWPDGSIHHIRALALIKRDDAGKAIRMIGTNWEITDQKRAEAQLRESEERFRATFEQAAVGIVHTGFDGSFLRCNARFAEIIGYPQQEVPCLNFQQITVPGDLSDSEAILHQMKRGVPEDVSIEKRYRRKDGSFTWARVTVSMQHDDEGHPLHHVAIVEDINDRKAAEESLRAAMEAVRTSEAHYRTIFQTSTDGIVISRVDDSTFIDANNTLLEMMGYEREELIGRSAVELGFWTEPELRKAMASALHEQAGFRDWEVPIRKKSGELVWVLLSSSKMVAEGVPCALTMVRDVSEARNAAERLAAAHREKQDIEMRYRLAFQTSLDAINISRLSDGLYIEVNQAFLDITGYDRDEVIGRTGLELGILTGSFDRQKMVEVLRSTGNCQLLEAQFRKKNGEIIWGQTSASLMDLDGVPCIFSITRDVTDARKSAEEIKNLAFFDVLTKLPNRRFGAEQLRQALSASVRSNRKGALLFIDLDNFKRMNDTLGHKTGDLQLHEIARRLKTCIRDADTVARLGGDEFVVILENLGETEEEAAAHARTVAEKILGVVSQVYHLAGRECHTTCSIGVAVFGDRLDAADTILQQADIAMYQAKAAGRNTVRFFAPALQTAITARASLEEDLRHAIATEQFQLYYQPQVDSGMVVGVEALLRWKHPTRGVRLPMEFISLAEETGLILPLGHWVLETGCKQIARWAKHKQTAGLSIAVNISARQLRQPNFVEQVLSLISRTGANPHNLKLEMTESMLVDNVEEVIAKMVTLRSHGVQFSMDDFGTGYSSLSYLKRFPLDQMKIDRAFVRDMLVDVTSGAIAQTIISLSKAMGIKVIAEGVETTAQRDFLAGLGCTAFQGYLISPPVSLEEFQLLLADSAEDGSAPCQSTESNLGIACSPESLN